MTDHPGVETPQVETAVPEEKPASQPKSAPRRSMPFIGRYAHVTGWGMAVPERVMDNNELATIVDTTDEWIVSHTGIKERHVAASDQTSASLAVDAAIKALEVANLKPTDLDLIVVSSATPEHLFPSTACLVQDRLGASQAGAYDVLAACSGFVYALYTAAQSIRTGAHQNVLVIGAETLTRFVNWQDRNTCILFGDGAGAFVLQGSDEPGGVLSGILRSDGSGGDALSIPAGGSHMPASFETVSNGSHYIQMNGREVFRFATRVMASATRSAIQAAGLAFEDIAWIVPHQANIRIIEKAMRDLNVPMDRCVINIDRYGNTSTASIPIAICEAVADGRIQPGDYLVLVGFGGGLTWGSSVLRWSGPFPSKGRVNPLRYRMLARVRSMLLRGVRQIEGMIWGRK
ncbi:MAG: beta-ketoacyl-ACP synthase III [Chloroflexota bacterium]